MMYTARKSVCFLSKIKFLSPENWRCKKISGIESYKYIVNLLVASHGNSQGYFTISKQFSFASDRKPILAVHDAFHIETPNNEDICIKGWVKSIRKMGKNFTFIDIIDGLSPSRLQVIVDTKLVPDDICFHSAVSAEGVLVKSSHKGQALELHAKVVNLINPTRISDTNDSKWDSKNTDITNTNQVNNTKNGEDYSNTSAKNITSILKDNEMPLQTETSHLYPFTPRKNYPEDFCRKFPQYRSKLADFGCVLRIRSTATQAIHDFFQKRKFVHIHTPLLTASDCEGAGEVFSVKPASIQRQPTNTEDASNRQEKDQHAGEALYFDRDVYLTVSGQLHLEAICNGISRVYNFSPVFRAESGRSRKHLSEFWMVEAEVGFAYDLKIDVIDLLESLVKQTICAVLENNSADLATFAELNQKNKLSKHSTDVELLNAIADIHKSFVTMTYQEAIEILLKHENEFQSKPRYGESFGNEHELFLVEKHCNNIPVHIVDWPVSTKPFYSRLKSSDFDSAENEQLVSAVDLLFPKVGELCGGALREYRHDILLRRMNQCDNDGKLLNTLQWYLDLRNVGGASPTGGFGMGFDRLIQFILGINNIRDAMPFPRTPHKCRL